MEERILELLKQVFKEESIDKTCSQENCKQWDSMNQLNLVIEIEDTFGITMEPEEIAEMKNFDDIVNIVKRKMNSAD